LCIASGGNALANVQSPLSSSIFAPAVGNAAEEFGVTSSILISLGVTAYLFGYGVINYMSLSDNVSRQLMKQ
jgi:hypothetical protein